MSIGAIAAGLAILLGDAVTKIIATAIYGIAGTILTLVCSVTIISPGETGVPIVFGSVDTETHYSEGLHFINPVASISRFDVKRRSIDFKGESVLEVISRDRVKLSVDATITYRINPEYTGLLRQRIGAPGKIDAQLITPASRAAFRNAAAMFNWTDAAVESREEYAFAIEEAFRTALAADLAGNGVDSEIAGEVILIGNVQLREVDPPTKIAAAISERLAQQEHLDKQYILTNIAAEEANRRRNEGQGIRNLLDLALGNAQYDDEGNPIPSTIEYSPEAVRIVLSAIADKTRADAMAAAVEAGNVNVMVMGGNTQPSVNVSNR